MYYFTEEGLQKAKDCLEQIKEKYKKDIMDLSGERENKLCESGSFLFSRTELSNKFLYESRKLLERINKAILIEQTDEYINWDGLTVIKKSEVIIDFDGEIETYKILGDGETDLEENIITYETDLAKALLGHKINDVVSFRGCNIIIKDVKKIEKAKKLILK